MENQSSSTIDLRIAERLKALRGERGWSLDELAKRANVSRATLSRLENAEVSATANVLGKLCAAYGLPMSRLIRMVEEGFEPLMRRNAQPFWSDPQTGFARLSVSPPAASLAGEVLACALPAGVRLDYDAPPRSGLEHHLLLTEGCLSVSIEDTSYDLSSGDCLRYRLSGASSFSTPKDQGAKYNLFIV
ncbi:helix-turn-helix domain-containing protein [Rhizobiales bacterium]|uniref:XRE family transcriptional regulator n=1 Tax=Hongsoonwoonella zoysiae TaxID=2821844 RepID=UPI001560EC86|nr:XRE family transcriptional regulator [Hongsoonwoonella zoysiae]NRG17905.1 helix-turn-helix domain-containing protein [Hongsoonwoonella zoysiae]